MCVCVCVYYGHRVVKGMCYADNLWVLMGGRWEALWYAERVYVFIYALCVCVYLFVCIFLCVYACSLYEHEHCLGTKIL